VAGGPSGAGPTGDGGVGGSSGTALTGPVPSKSTDMPTLAVITAVLAMRLTSIVFVPSRPPCLGYLPGLQTKITLQRNESYVAL
jgi:hypothetical protein